MEYQVTPVGNRITCVFHGLDEKVINNTNFLQKSLREALKQDNFTILGSIIHRFKPVGFTSLVLLAESHASIHTYPEHLSAVFDLYTCRGLEDGRKTYVYLKEQLNPTEIREYKEDPVIVDPNFKISLQENN